MTDNSGTSPAGILDHAQAVLNGTHAIPKPQASRAAAMLARQALEDTIDSLCVAAGANLRNARMRSRLVSLRIIVSESIADLAGIAWSGLSRACHHHAYELTPTAGEVQHLIDLVTEVTSHTPSRPRPWDT